MVDLIGNVGHLQEVEDIINTMSSKTKWPCEDGLTHGL